MGQTTPTPLAKKNVRSFTHCVSLSAVNRSKKNVCEEQIDRLSILKHIRVSAMSFSDFFLIIIKDGIFES